MVSSWARRGSGRQLENHRESLMIALPPVTTLRSIVEQPAGGLAGEVIVWSTESVADRVRALVPWEVTTETPTLTKSTAWLLAVGGGKLLDKAKVLRSHHPHVKLAALPTLWGSGAEASPIAVLDEDGRKVIRVAPELLPNLIVSHPAFAQSLPDKLIKYACGDAWCHALEGFLSPLGTDESRADLADLLRRMLQQPLNYTPEWFELSALACAAQSKTSVGVAHGIAHVLEGGMSWGHAELCSLYLLPAMSFNKTNSPKWPLLAASGLPDNAIFMTLHTLFDNEAYLATLPALTSNWAKVLRDKCTRINSALIRPQDLEFFASFRA